MFVSSSAKHAVQVRARRGPFVLTGSEYTTNVSGTFPASDADWFTKGHVMCYHVTVTVHVKDP